MEIKSAEIKYFRKSGFTSCSSDNVKHVKVLPWLSVVQSVEGSYDIALGAGETLKTGRGGFFIAPSGVQQTIVHHSDPESRQITCRWLFLDAEINKAYKLDSLYGFPTVPDEAVRREMNELFDLLFATDDILDNYSCCYRILGLLLRTATPTVKRFNQGIQNAVSYLTENFAERITVEKLARVANMSESNFYAAFKRNFGSSPISYLNHYRLSLAADRLTETDDAVNEIGYAVGIEDPLYFSKLFKKTYGASPREYRSIHKKQ